MGHTVWSGDFTTTSLYPYILLLNLKGFSGKKVINILCLKWIINVWAVGFRTAERRGCSICVAVPGTALRSYSFK